jgi:hypothetical protein
VSLNLVTSIDRSAKYEEVGWTHEEDDDNGDADGDEEG